MKTIEQWALTDIRVTGLKPSIRTFHGASVMGDKLIVFGGRNMSKRLNDTLFLNLTELQPGKAKRRKSLTEAQILENALPVTQDSILHKTFKENKKKICLDDFQLSTTLGLFVFFSLFFCFCLALLCFIFIFIFSLCVFVFIGCNPVCMLNMQALFYFVAFVSVKDFEILGV